jgi:hypothetical protein
LLAYTRILFEIGEKLVKLKTTEKVVENGIEVWIVDPAEVSQIALQPKANNLDNNVNTVNIPDVNPTPTTTPLAGGFEQSLVFMRESVVKPLTDLVERQSNQIKEMSEEIGTLKERLRALEAAQAGREATACPGPGRGPAGRDYTQGTGPATNRPGAAKAGLVAAYYSEAKHAFGLFCRGCPGYKYSGFSCFMACLSKRCWESKGKFCSKKGAGLFRF